MHPSDEAEASNSGRGPVPAHHKGNTGGMQAITWYEVAFNLAARAKLPVNTINIKKHDTAN